jgi:ABC-type Fe3+/spermidine/putrescine transport system ATPase subunit
MNFFEGTVTANTANSMTIATHVLGEVHTTPEKSFPVGAEVWVAIRPEKLRPEFTSPVEGTVSIEGRMGPSAYLGDRSHFYVHVTDRDDPVLVALQNLEGSLDQLSRPDQPVWLGWSENAVVVLAKN